LTLNPVFCFRFSTKASYLGESGPGLFLISLKPGLFEFLYSAVRSIDYIEIALPVSDEYLDMIPP
jgi:hypothetical protein